MYKKTFSKLIQIFLILMLGLGMNVLTVTANEKTNIVIDKSDYSLKVYEADRLLREYPIAVGANSGEKTRVGDLKTPTGKFEVDEVLDAIDWTHDFQDGKGEIAEAYGPYFISLVTGWDGIGIHGTHDSTSIGKKVSEGCIRMYNTDLVELRTEYIYIGMPVVIKE